ncbi:MAG: N-acetylmuramoyl-L-alanine amidase [Deltaproteobacteria bacterium]|nr:N-acetylmuramoyl-L-alanine amidase [Deltaproteobacteria bacterium]
MMQGIAHRPRLCYFSLTMRWGIATVSLLFALVTPALLRAGFAAAPTPAGAPSAAATSVSPAGAPDPAAASEAAYQSARACYYDLKKHPERRKMRESWEGCMRQFLVVARDYPQSDRGADALFTVGKMYEELYAASRNVEDMRFAVDRYQQFAKGHKTHRLADDALYRIGRIRADVFKQQRQAKAIMRRLVRWYPESDMTIEAKKFLGMAVRNAPVRTPPADKAAPPDAAKKGEPFTIVIDPGHGGKDAGAIGPTGAREKDVTLAISKRLAAILRQAGYAVALTRTADIFLTLDERNTVANRRKADLFLSIHANASTAKTQHGVQTYYLNNATDDAARRLADRENRAAGKSTNEVATIVSTMLQNAMTDASRELAKAVHGAVVDQLGKRFSSVNDQGVRTALFYVLVGAKSPSILVETAYISHPQEEKRLKDPHFQTALAKAIASGVRQFATHTVARVSRL